MSRESSCCALRSDRAKLFSASAPVHLSTRPCADGTNAEVSVSSVLVLPSRPSQSPGQLSVTRHAAPSSTSIGRSQGLQILDEVGDFLRREPQSEEAVVVVDDGLEVREPAVVVVAPLGMTPEP